MRERERERAKEKEKEESVVRPQKHVRTGLDCIAQAVFVRACGNVFYLTREISKSLPPIASPVTFPGVHMGSE